MAQLAQHVAADPRLLQEMQTRRLQGPDLMNALMIQQAQARNAARYGTQRPEDTSEAALMDRVLARTSFHGDRMPEDQMNANNVADLRQGLADRGVKKSHRTGGVQLDEASKISAGGVAARLAEAKRQQEERAREMTRAKAASPEEREKRLQKQQAASARVREQQAIAAKANHGLSLTQQLAAKMGDKWVGADNQKEVDTNGLDNLLAARAKAQSPEEIARRQEKQRQMSLRVQDNQRVSKQVKHGLSITQQLQAAMGDKWAGNELRTGTNNEEGARRITGKVDNAGLDALLAVSKPKVAPGKLKKDGVGAALGNMLSKKAAGEVPKFSQRPPVASNDSGTTTIVSKAAQPPSDETGTGAPKAAVVGGKKGAAPPVPGTNKGGKKGGGPAVPQEGGRRVVEPASVEDVTSLDISSAAAPAKPMKLPPSAKNSSDKNQTGAPRHVPALRLSQVDQQQLLQKQSKDSNTTSSSNAIPTPGRRKPRPTLDHTAIPSDIMFSAEQPFQGFDDPDPGEGGAPEEHFTYPEELRKPKR
ncbi:unnamed protein product [Amoebophrya sp. A25]|nr:unnamed protein product [Amoebophrya sp. A25]|eukprot:GSA25T00021768001.1